jgi:hypothetical protein
MFSIFISEARQTAGISKSYDYGRLILPAFCTPVQDLERLFRGYLLHYFSPVDSLTVGVDFMNEVKFTMQVKQAQIRPNAVVQSPPSQL